MTNSIARDLLLLPNEQERKQIFYLLKKHSSWTAWNRLLGYFQKWADVTEESIRQSDERGLFSKTVFPDGYTTPPGIRDDLGQTSIVQRDFVKVLQGLALFDEGVRRLARGDKRVFTADEATGLFERAYDEATISYYVQAKWKLEDGEIGWKETTPLMKEFFEALDELCMAWGECGRDITEPFDPHYPEKTFPAKLSYGLREMILLPQFPYPKPLPDLPEIFDIVEVKTGELVPCSGIWEPVESGYPTGTMNYLHGGQPAPKYEQDSRNKNDRVWGSYCHAFDATWRMLWRDDRYKDGTIPEEEQDYQFLEPRQLGEESLSTIDIVKYLKIHNLPNPLVEAVPPQDMRCEGGQPCPHDGHWWTPASQLGKGHFKKGDVMPDFPSSKYGSTIWYRMKE